MTASLTNTPQDPPSLAPLVALLAADMEQVNARIIARITSDVPLVPAVASHLIAAGGKRLRPYLHWLEPVWLAVAHMPLV